MGRNSKFYSNLPKHKIEKIEKYIKELDIEEDKNDIKNRVCDLWNSEKNTDIGFGEGKEMKQYINIPPSKVARIRNILEDSD